MTELTPEQLILQYEADIAKLKDRIKGYEDYNVNDLNKLMDAHGDIQRLEKRIAVLKKV